MNWLFTKKAYELNLIWIILYFFINETFGIIIFLFLVYFFRNPDIIVRKTKGNFIYSPSYGTIEDIQYLPNSIRISTFLSPFDVHSIYSPITGTVLNTKYIPGKFNPANLGKKTEDNERFITNIQGQTKNGQIYNIEVIQIAGVLVRRILNWTKELEFLKLHEKIGLIKFGSRVDTIIPYEIIKNIKIEPGQKISPDSELVEIF